MTGNTKFEQLKGKLESVENKMDIEKSDEDLKKLRTEGFEILKNVLEENSHFPDKDFKELWKVGFRFLGKNLKEDPKYCEEVVSIFENYGEQKRKLIWRYVAHLSIQIIEKDPKNKPASGMLEEVVQFLDKMEKDEWKKDWDLVLRITKNVVSRDPKNESAKNLIIEAERIAKDEEEKMEVSVSENAKRLEKVEFEGLTEEGQMAWVVLKKMHGLYWKDGYWLCQANSDQEIHDKLFDALEKFIVSPNALSPDDVNVICERFVRTINLCRRKLGISPYELGELSKEESHVKKKSKPRPLPKDALLKIQAPKGLEKLESLFGDLEQQSMVAEGTTTNLDNHFTEDAKKLAVPNEIPQIKWTSNLYELRSLIRSLKAAEWIESKLDMIARHFLFNGKTTTYNQLNKGPTGSEKLQRLESILTEHEVPLQI